MSLTETNKGSKMPPEMRRYMKRMFLCMAFYGATLILAVTMFNRDAVSGPLAYILGILPALPIIGIFWTIGKLINETQDEYQRLLLIRQVIVAVGFTLSLATIWGFLEQFNLLFHIPAYYWSVLWFLGLFVGMVFNKITMGDI